MSTKQNTCLSRLLALGLLTILSLVACSEQGADSDQPAPAENPYSGWKTYSYENMVILYPPNHPNENQFEEICRNYINAIAQVSEKLGMPSYNDTLLFVYYSGYGQGREMTGHEYPFATDTAIHFWQPSFPGPVLMQYLLPRWSPGGTRFPFLHHGLISLFDFSGQAYHESTIGYYNKGRFIPLEELAADTAVDSDTERYQSALGASFVAFIISQTGAAGIKALYEADLPFPQSVELLFGITVDSLENAWLHFVRLNVPPDSLHDETPEQ